MKQNLMDKKGQTGGLVGGLVFGIAGLIIGVIIAFVIVGTLNDASLLTAGSAEANATTNLISNFTSGVDSVAPKLATGLLIAGVVLILSILLVLVAVWKRMNMGGGGAQL